MIGRAVKIESEDSTIISKALLDTLKSDPLTVAMVKPDSIPDAKDTTPIKHEKDKPTDNLELLPKDSQNFETTGNHANRNIEPSSTSNIPILEAPHEKDNQTTHENG